jgi:cyclic pyranopterin phosphate synthase
MDRYFSHYFRGYNLMMQNDKLSHIDSSGHIRMVDIDQKAETERLAIAGGVVEMAPRTFELIKAGALKKGDVLTTAQIAGIMAAKRTAELIPLCHPILLTQIDVNCELNPELPGVVITARVRTTGKTGAEMEALTAVSIAALTIYDMAKAVDKKMKIQNIRLIEKHGGISGDIVNE